MLKPKITGSLSRVDEKPDPEKHHVEINAIIQPSTRNALAKVELVMPKGNKGKIQKVLDAETGNTANFISDNGRIMVYGKDIYVVPEAGRTGIGPEGCAYLVDERGDRVGGFEVESASSKVLTLALHMEKDVADSKCTIVVESAGTPERARNPEATLRVCEAKIAFKKT